MTTATKTERDLMDTNRFRLENIADRQRTLVRGYVIGAALLAVAAFITTAVLL